MRLAIQAVLDAGTVAALRRELAASAELVDGRGSAGRTARVVKHNLQVRGADARKQALRHTLLAHPLLQLAARPQAATLPLLSCYRPGMAYGSHVDDAWIGELRSDLAYTLFLSDPADYEGGALVLEDEGGEQSYKLPAGSLLLYDCGLIHRVEPVTAGERWAAVGWIQSRVPDAEFRSILFDLEQVKHALRLREADPERPASREFLLLSQGCGRLLRRCSR